MLKTKHILPVLLICSLMLVAGGCATAQVENTTESVTNATADTVDTVLGTVGAIVVYPFHLVAALFS